MVPLLMVNKHILGVGGDSSGVHAGREKRRLYSQYRGCKKKKLSV
jgi:hypothetical protein